jgi:UDP-2,3-diacylglucosamine pyrophosphatase LpxH
MTSADSTHASRSRIDALFDAVLSGADPSPLADPHALYGELWEITRALARNADYQAWSTAHGKHFSIFDFEGPPPAIAGEDDLEDESEKDIGGGAIPLTSLRNALFDLGRAANHLPDEYRGLIDRLQFLLAVAAWKAGSDRFRTRDVEDYIRFHIPRKRSGAFRDFRRNVFRLPPRRLWVMSDIHLECGEWLPEARPEFDALIVAGDVNEGDPAAVTDWIARVADGRPAVFVPGNHDYCVSWSNIMSKEDIIKALKDQGAAKGVTVLDGDAVDLTIQGQETRFIGATLWTDWKLADLALRDRLPKADRLRMVHSGIEDAQHWREGAVDYTRIITQVPKEGEPGTKWSVADAVSDHARMRLFIEDELVNEKDTAVVVTHHAPSARSYGEKFERMDFFPLWEPGFYASDLEDTIEAIGPDLWVHGHIHRKADYQVGETRVISNPKGRRSYNGKMTSGFEEGLVIEI